MNTQKFRWDTANVIFWQVMAIFICAAGLWIVFSYPVEIKLFSIFLLGIALYVGYWGPVSDLVRYSDEEDSCRDSIRRAKLSFYKLAPVWGFCSYMGWWPLPGYLQRRIQKVSDELEQRRLEKEQQATVQRLDQIRQTRERAVGNARMGKLSLDCMTFLYDEGEFDALWCIVRSLTEYVEISEEMFEHSLQISQAELSILQGHVVVPIENEGLRATYERLCLRYVSRVSALQDVLVLLRQLAQEVKNLGTEDIAPEDVFQQSVIAVETYRRQIQEKLEEADRALAPI